MSNEDGGKVEDQGIPGYSANNTIPGGFALPLPTATNSSDPEPEAEADETADPWSSTWDDTSWQLPDSDSSESLYSSEELANYAGGTHVPLRLGRLPRPRGGAGDRGRGR